LCSVDFDVGEGIVTPKFLIDDAGHSRVPMFDFGLEVSSYWNSSHVFALNGSSGGCDYYNYLGANALVNVSGVVNGVPVFETCLWTECQSVKGWVEQVPVGMLGLVNCGESWKFQVGYGNVTHQIRAQGLQLAGSYVYLDQVLVSKWATVDVQFGRRELFCSIDNERCKGSVYSLSCSLYWDGPDCAELKLAAHKNKAYQYIPLDITGCTGQFGFDLFLDLESIGSVSVELVGAEYMQLEVPTCLSNVSVPGEVLLWKGGSVVTPSPLAVEEDSNWWIWLIVAMGGVVLVGALVLMLLLVVPRCRKNKKQGEYGLTVLSEF
jgi:hypothetical protein